MAGNSTTIDQTSFKIALLRAGLAQKELAEKLGFSYTSLYHRINGKTPWTEKDIKLVTKILGCRWASLLQK